MKKIFLYAATLSFTVQGIAVAQQQGSPITENEYQVVITSVCEASVNATPGDILSAVAANASSSISSEKIRDLQELALEMYSMPSAEKERFCNQSELAS